MCPKFNPLSITIASRPSQHDEGFTEVTLTPKNSPPTPYFTPLNTPFTPYFTPSSTPFPTPTPFNTPTMSTRVPPTPYHTPTSSPKLTRPSCATTPSSPIIHPMNGLVYFDKESKTFFEYLRPAGNPFDPSQEIWVARSMDAMEKPFEFVWSDEIEIDEVKLYLMSKSSMMQMQQRHMERMMLDQEDVRADWVYW